MGLGGSDMDIDSARLRVVVYKDQGWWIIQGLDYDFVALARRLEDVPDEIRRFLSVLFAASRQLGVEPFFGYSPAPPKYWKMYERAAPWAEPLLPFELPGDLGSSPAIDTRLAA
jgi:hypothetical protein